MKWPWNGLKQGEKRIESPSFEMITKYSETLRLKEESLRLIETGAVTVTVPRLNELKGEILLLRRLESDEIKEAIDEMIEGL
jgi:hypothetical protein